MIHTIRQHQNEIPYSMISRKVVQKLKNVNALAIWIYLQTKPEGWIVRENHLREHFSLGREKYLKAMRDLRDFHLYDIQRVKDENGKFTSTIWHIYATPNHRYGKPHIRETVHTENHTYIKEKEIITEKEITTENKEHGRCAKMFDEFWKVYPKKAGKKDCLKKWKTLKLDEFGLLIIADVTRRRIDDVGWCDGYIPNPLTYLNGARWEDEIKTRRANTNGNNRITEADVYADF